MIAPPNRKLTPPAVRLIRRLRGRGVKLRVIAERFGVCVSAVHLAATRKTWKGVA